MEDDLMKDQREEAVIGREHDLAELKAIVRRKYPTPISAVEPYRSGYITDEEIDNAFSKEEAVFIRIKKQERDKGDAAFSSADVDL